MRSPLDSFWTLLEYVRAVDDRLRCAVNASTFVLMRVDMMASPCLSRLARRFPYHLRKLSVPHDRGTYTAIIGRPTQHLRPLRDLFQSRQRGLVVVVGCWWLAVAERRNNRLERAVVSRRRGSDIFDLDLLEYFVAQDGDRPLCVDTELHAVTIYAQYRDDNIVAQVQALLGFAAQNEHVRPPRC